jgi:hypothetical protein
MSARNVRDLTLQEEEEDEDDDEEEGVPKCELNKASLKLSTKTVFPRPGLP